VRLRFEPAITPARGSRAEITVCFRMVGFRIGFGCGSESRSLRWQLVCRAGLGRRRPASRRLASFSAAAGVFGGGLVSAVVQAPSALEWMRGLHPPGLPYWITYWTGQVINQLLLYAVVISLLTGVRPPSLGPGGARGLDSGGLPGGGWDVSAALRSVACTRHLVDAVVPRSDLPAL